LTSSASDTMNVPQREKSVPISLLKALNSLVRGEKLLWFAFFLALLPIFIADPGIVVGDTLTSRLASVYALVHNGTWCIDRPVSQPPNPFEGMTVDKVQTADGRLISSKPPVLPLMMAFEYWAMNRLFGWELTNQEELRPILRVMIASLIKSAYVIGVFFFVLLLRLFVVNPLRAACILLMLAFASPILGYSFQINNHTPSAAAVCGVLYFGLGLYTRKLKPEPWRFILFGLCSAFVFVTDIPITIFPASISVLLFLRFPKACLTWVLLGAAPLLFLHFMLMTLITGNPLPVQTQESMYNFRNSYWRNPTGVDGLNESRLLYLFHSYFGRFGTFLLFPVLLLGIAGGIRGLCDKTCPLRMPILFLTSAFLVLTLYYTMETNNYGGAAYGFRWHIGVVPVLLAMAIPQIIAVNKRYQWALVSLLFLVSAYSAWECFRAPWGASHEWTCRLIFGPVF
jgi:hypothetical protein